MNKTKLQIQLYGSRILNKKCRVVKSNDNAVSDLFDAMLELMRSLNGIGLAANQAGLDMRLVVIELPDLLLRMINPKIISKSGQTAIDEGCLSFPDLILKVLRAKNVVVRYTDEKGAVNEIEADGLLSIALQHEIDHINGITFNKRVSLKQQFKIRKKLKEIKQISRV